MSTERSKEIIESALKVLAAEEVLMRAFAQGVTPGELAKALKISPPAATRTLNTLATAGRAERIAETGRWRSSHRMGRLAVQSVHALDRAAADARDSRARLDPDGTIAVQSY